MKIKNRYQIEYRYQNIANLPDRYIFILDKNQGWSKPVMDLWFEIFVQVDDVSTVIITN